MAEGETSTIIVVFVVIFMIGILAIGVYSVFGDRLTMKPTINVATPTTCPVCKECQDCSNNAKCPVCPDCASAASSTASGTQFALIQPATCNTSRECRYNPLSSCAAGNANFDSNNVYSTDYNEFIEKVAQNRAIAITPWVDGSNCKEIIAWGIEYEWDRTFDENGATTEIAIDDDKYVQGVSITKFVKRDRLRIFEAAIIRARYMSECKKIELLNITDIADRTDLNNKLNRLNNSAKTDTYVVVSGNAFQTDLIEHSAAIKPTYVAPISTRNTSCQNRQQLLTQAISSFSGDETNTNAVYSVAIAKLSSITDVNERTIAYQLFRLYNSAIVYLATLTTPQSACISIAICEDKGPSYRCPSPTAVGYGVSVAFRNPSVTFPAQSSITFDSSSSGDTKKQAMEDALLLGMREFALADSCSRASNDLRQKLLLSSDSTSRHDFNIDPSRLIDASINVRVVVCLTKVAGQTTINGAGVDMTVDNSTYVVRYDSATAIRILKGLQLSFGS